VQLVQAHVPLHQAAQAFSQRDASGRVPIVVVPERATRINLPLLGIAGLVLLGGLVWGWLQGDGGVTLLGSGALVAAVVLTVLAVMGAFIVPVPEGTIALLARSGRYSGTLSSGRHFLLPWIAVTHLVTRRAIPFVMPPVEAPTQDDVLASVETLVTFTIADPYRFVYSVSADDFDQVFEAACVDALRALVRRVPSSAVADLARQEAATLRESIGEVAAPYGVTVSRVSITYAQPPADFLRSQAARQLAVVQRTEQAEAQALAQHRQADEDALARQRLHAQLERQRDEVQAAAERAEARRRVVELEAEVEALRLAKLEERLRAYPQAAHWEWEGAKLEVARALAGNTRAVLQVGNASDIAPALVIRDSLHDAALPDAAAAHAPEDEVPKRIERAERVDGRDTPDR
jgi:regulator of protease activity HflC (stomatin/prohibitin superfamily)